jgi:hypothetical protein
VGSTYEQPGPYGMSMLITRETRERPAVWGCEHQYPIEVVLVGNSGRRARCLGCGTCGPVVREGSEEAMLALRNQAQFRDKAGR